VGLYPRTSSNHTSLLRFLETRFGAEVPNLSTWRRATVGDLTSTFNFTKPDQSIPALPATQPAISQTITGCLASLSSTTPYPVPNPQSSPTQEAGTAARPKWSVLGANNDAVLGKRDLRKTRLELSEKPTSQAQQNDFRVAFIREQSVVSVNVFRNSHQRACSLICKIPFELRISNGLSALKRDVP